MASAEVIYGIVLFGGWHGVWRIAQGEQNPHPAPFAIRPRVVWRPRSCRRTFMGGTTAIAAKNAGREWIGIDEISGGVSLANKRMKEWYVKQSELFASIKKLFGKFRTLEKNSAGKISTGAAGNRWKSC